MTKQSSSLSGDDEERSGLGSLFENPLIGIEWKTVGSRGTVGAALNQRLLAHHETQFRCRLVFWYREGLTGHSRVQRLERRPSDD